MEPFTRIERADLGKMPAMVDISTGVLSLNEPVFGSYPKHWQRFILLHEAGHVILRTTNEQAATSYAIDHFINGSSQEEVNRQILQLSEILNSRQPDNASAKAEQKKWQTENPNNAGFWEAVLMVLDLGVDKLESDQAERENNASKEVKNTSLLALFSKDEIERQRTQRVVITYLPWITMAIIVITLIIVTVKK